MSGLYLAGLLAGISGLVIVDARWRLFLFASPLRAAVLLVLGIAGFLAWDLAGVGLGIFFEGNRSVLVGVDIARDVPLEELFFLLLLCLSAMETYCAAERMLARRGRQEVES